MQKLGIRRTQRCCSATAVSLTALAALARRAARSGAAARDVRTRQRVVEDRPEQEASARRSSSTVGGRRSTR